MAIGAVGTNGLPVALFAPEPKDQMRTEDEADQQCSDYRSSRAESNVTKQVEELELVGKRVKQGVQHRTMPLGGLLRRTVSRRYGRREHRGSLSRSRCR